MRIKEPSFLVLSTVTPPEQLGFMREQEKNRRSSGWVFVTGTVYSLQELASTQVIQSFAL
jgi:hypothetical protein